MFTLAIVQSALELGFIYALVAMALFLSFRVLNIADMTTDGAFTLGCAVSATAAVGGASVPWFYAGHAGRCLRRVCHRVPANPPGRAVHFGGYYYQYRALHRKPCHHGLFFQRSHAEN